MPFLVFTLKGDSQAVKPAPSTLHSNLVPGSLALKTNFAFARLLFFLVLSFFFGPLLIAVSGAVSSHGPRPLPTTFSWARPSCASSWKTSPATSSRSGGQPARE